MQQENCDASQEKKGGDKKAKHKKRKSAEGVEGGLRVYRRGA